MTTGGAADPHAAAAVVAAGAPLHRAKAAVVMLHGRGANAGDMLSLAEILAQPHLACLALEYAARHALGYGGLIGLSGGLIGPEETPRDQPAGPDPPTTPQET